MRQSKSKKSKDVGTLRQGDEIEVIMVHTESESAKINEPLQGWIYYEIQNERTITDMVKKQTSLMELQNTCVFTTLDPNLLLNRKDTKAEHKAIS